MKKHRVFIDARNIGAGRPDGFTKYTKALARGLAEVRNAAGGQLDYEPVFIVSSSEAQNAQRAEWKHGFEWVESSIPFLHPKELFGMKQILVRGRADLYHSPTFSSFLGRSPCPTVQTIHDLNHLQFGRLAQKLYYQAVLKPFAKRAAALLTVSDFSRRAIADWLGIPASQIEIASNVIETISPAPLAEAKEFLARLGLKEGKYFFCLSNPKRHKNTATLIAAHQKFCAQFAKAAEVWPLVLNFKVPRPEDFPNTRQLESVSDSEARILLTCAGASVFPSLYEGFGLPPVEAAASGVRVVVSRIPPHQEGLADLKVHEAIWVAPLDLHGWVTALHRVQKGELSPPSKESQLKISHRFRAFALGQKMDEIYRRMLDS